MKILVVLLFSLVLSAGCSRQSHQQRALFKQAALEEETSPGDAAEHYRQVVKIDATSELGRSALERANAMDRKSAEMRAEAERRISRRLNGN